MRNRLGHPLGLAEKILANHLVSPDADVERGISYVDFRPDRVVMQDATAQIAWLQFDTAGLSEVQVPTRGLSLKTELLITPGSEQVRATIERDGLLADFEALGAERYSTQPRKVSTGKAAK